MSRDYELDRLKSEEQSLFQAKQAALARWHDAQERANAAYNLSQEAWNARVSAKETLSYEYNQMVQSSENYRDVWDEYGHIREYNNFRMPKSAPSLAKLRRLDKTQSCVRQRLIAPHFMRRRQILIALKPSIKAARLSLKGLRQNAIA
ncbi:hypothetical protein HG461_003110 [Candidatus Saccharibacteria bacterium]|jgi:hypothetical protein|nr:hypothetical protein [Candidatus Saccharibacteria bacterium]MBB1532389.1 hypothetical protein [Candidatus Saccharibacteria bacterium]